MCGGAPEVPLKLRLERAEREIASDDLDTRYSGIWAVEDLGPEAAALIPVLSAAGGRIAASDDYREKAQLEKIRKTLLALGCAVNDLPRPPSRLEAYRGSTPREHKVVDGLVVADIGGFVQHGVVSVPVSSLGLWDNGTGKLLFVVDGAQLLEPVPGRREAACLRTIVRADAKHGGTSRSDLDWVFERRSVPCGDTVSSLKIPRAFTYGWPSSLSVSLQAQDIVVSVVVGDEDEPSQFRIQLGREGLADVLLDDKPVFLRRRRR
jgi:hypothetical protein